MTLALLLLKVVMFCTSTVRYLMYGTPFEQPKNLLNGTSESLEIHLTIAPPPNPPTRLRSQHFVSTSTSDAGIRLEADVTCSG